MGPVEVPADHNAEPGAGGAAGLLGELEGDPVEHIPACSPQARSRSERLNATLQDRVVNDLRLAGITTGEAANASLREHFIPT